MSTCILKFVTFLASLSQSCHKIAIFCVYCKRGNIRGALIFVNFVQNSASANSKTRKNSAIFCMHILENVGVV